MTPARAKSGRRLLATWVVAMGWAACASEPMATDPVDGGSDAGVDASDVGADVSAPAPATQGFVPEALGVAQSWYDYEQVTHALTPKPERYVARWGQTAASLRVLSYYNIEGDSGYFTLGIQTQSMVQPDWQDETIVELAENVKDAPVCVDVVTAASVSCDGDHDLVLRIDRRAVPAAGFSVSEPSVYFVGGETLTVWRVPEGSDFDPFSPPDMFRAPSAIRKDGDSVLGDWFGSAADGLIALQATSDFRACAWDIAENADRDFEVTHRCVPLELSPGGQTPLEEGVVQLATIARADLAGAGGEGIVYVSLPSDGPAVLARVDAEVAVGDWPDRWDFALRRTAAGTFEPVVSPGAMVMLRDGAVTEPSTLELPPALWEL